MPKIKISNLILFVIIVLGFSLRIWGLDFGLPYQFHQDEPIIVNHALAYGSGDLNPHFFIIPPLASYILFVFYGLYFLILKLSGVVNNSDSFVINFFRNPTGFYLIGRFLLGLIPSLVSICLTHFISRKLFSRRAALYAAFFMAVAFLNVVNAHYIYTDNLLVMFILSAYLIILSLINHPTRLKCILSGFFIGLSIASKYNAGIMIVPFFAAYFFSKKENRAFEVIIKDISTFIIVLFVTFIVCNPYAVLDYKLFFLSVPGRIRHSYIGWFHHIQYSLFEGVGFISVLLGISGLICALKKQFKIVSILLLFPVIFYLHLVFASQVFSRYALALIPFLSIGIGFLLFDFLGQKIKSQFYQRIIVFISVLLVIPTLIKSIKADQLFAGCDTRVEATEWIKINIPLFSKIALDNTFFRPQISQTAAQLKEKQGILNKQPELKELKSKKLDLQLKALEDDKTFETYYLVQGGEQSGQFLNFWPVITNNLNELREKGIEYVIFNNMTSAQSMRKFHEEIARKFALIAVFNPYYKSGFRFSYDDFETTCMPVAGKELFSRESFGPYIEIYKIK
jgi:4-amino-4-deoxy-L-arabinose transferase-like glycosyltransferase